MKDGAHTHGHNGGGGLALAAIVAVVALAGGLAETLARVLSIMFICGAVIAGLVIVGWVTRAVVIYRSEHATYTQMTGTVRRGQLTGADPAGREVVTLRQAVAELHDQLAAARALPPPPARHEHLHLHGLAAEQVAAILAARQQATPPTQEQEWQ